jgi:hypothetical protein
MKQPERDEDLLLPWHVNQTLPSDQRKSVDQALAESPTLAAERIWLESLRQDLQQHGPERADDAGLDRLMARIAGERAGTVLPFPSPPVMARPTWRTRGFAIAASIILGQAAVLGLLLHEREQSTPLTPLSGPQTVVDGVLVQVVFSEQASELAIRTALLDAQGEIVGGPGAVGVYLVRLADAEGLERLRRQVGIVESAVQEDSR